MCLPACVDDAVCHPGSRCRDLLAGGPNPAWTRACFAEYPLDVGARCGEGPGKPTDADCAGGLCADLGAFGRCAADCSVIACPPGTACGRFGDGRTLCLAACPGAASATSTRPDSGVTPTCDDDPLLACEAPGAPGPLGFSVSAGSPATNTYCAPKRCTRNAECAPTGTCPAGGGHCQRVLAPAQ